MTELIKYDAACRALAEAKSLDEIQNIRDKAEAVRAYGRVAKNKALEIDAAEIRLRAERKYGQALAELKGKGLLSEGGRPSKKPVPNGEQVSLSDLGATRKFSSYTQKLASVPDAEFEGMVGEWRENVAKEGERVTTRLLREGEKAQRDEALARAPVEWPEGQYPIIYADPPWRYEHPPIGASNRSIENHYPTMTIEEICALPVQEIAAENAVLFLWATAPKLAECFYVIDEWGFKYRTCMVWVKDKIGMGYHARNQHEILLIAKRGQLAPPEPSDRPSSVVHAPRNEHSAKPEQFYRLIEQMYPGLPKVELFCRTPQPGWAAWGNQAGGGNGAGA